MSFSWVGAANYLRERRQRDFDREILEQKRKDDITRMLLPTLMERISERKKVASQREAVYKKGVSLFGKDTANALENMGSLDEVVSQYKGTEADRGWAQAIVARVGDQIDELLNSDDESKRELGKNLLKRGAMYTEADAGEKDNYLLDVMSDGYLSYEEFMNFDLPGTPTSSYSGTVPDLGKPKLYSAEGLNKAATQLTANLLGDQADLRIGANGEYTVVAPSIDPRVLAGLTNGIKTILEENQYRYGTSGAEKVAIDSFDTIADKYGLNPKDKTPPPEDMTTPADLQEGMGNLSGGAPVFPAEGVEQDYQSTNDFAPGVLEGTSNRGFR